MPSPTSSPNSATDRPAAFLEVRDIEKSFGPRKAVGGISLCIDRGEIVGLLGPNGAGKSTTFKITIGILAPDKGGIYLGGEEITGLPMYLRARRGIGYLSQEPAVFTRLTVRDNLLAILETMHLSRSAAQASLERHLHALNIAHLADNYAGTLSGGERRRLEIARALLPEPSVIFLDEPFSGVDPISVAEIQDIIRKLCRQNNIGFLITDHNVRETLSITDWAYIIQNGMILRDGTPAEIVADPLVRKAYLGENFRLG
ncbi:MAG: LPS export ABC transporter ATP-binding protein [Planctomycetota bacterium]